MQSSELKNTGIGALSLLFWGTSIPFARHCVEELGAFTAAVTVMLSGGCLGLLAFRRMGLLDNAVFLRHRPFWGRLSLYVAYVALFYLALGVVDRDQVPTVTFLNYLWPTATIVFSLLLFRQPVRKIWFSLGTLVVLAGIAVELFGGDLAVLVKGAADARHSIGFAAAFAGALIWGLSSAFARRWGLSAGGVAGVPFMLVGAACCLVPVMFLFEGVPHPSAAVLLPAIYLALAPMLGHICWDVGMRKGNVVVLSLLADTLPWISLTFAKVYLGVAITGSTWLAAVLIVAGAVISRFALRAKA